MKDPSGALSFINEGERFLVSTHINPDGDGLGSVLALRWLIASMGKKADIVIASKPPATYDYLSGYDAVTMFDPNGEAGGQYDRVIIADAPHRQRLGEVEALIADTAKVLIIDHHPHDGPSEEAAFVDQGASSSAELVYRLIVAAGAKVDTACAEYLYTGLLIDTGRFRFSNTSPAALQMAADLVAAGVKPDKVADRLFFHTTFETAMALGKMLGTIELHLNGRVATAWFDHEFVSSPEWKKVDTEGFVNHALAIVGVEVAALMREVKPGVTRTSLRAKHDFDVNLLANEFGGGGHKKAAGCTLNFDLASAKRKLLDAIATRL